MEDGFFSLDQLLADAYTDALTEGRYVSAHWVHVLRGAIEEENNA